MKCLEIILPASDGKEYSLEDFKGKNVVLFFYPKDNTPGWTKEAKEFTIARVAFEKLNTVIIGVSRDSIKSHLKFIEKQELNLLLLSDKESKLCECFEVLKLKKLYGKEYLGVERSTFILDETGTIIKEWRNVKVEGHAGEVYGFLASLK